MLNLKIKYISLLLMWIIPHILPQKIYATSYIDLGNHVRIKILNYNGFNISDAKVLTIPIKRSQNLILLEGEIDGQQGNFILDTGAPYLVLNQTYFRDYIHEKQTEEASGINGDAETYKINIKK